MFNNTLANKLDPGAQDPSQNQGEELDQSEFLQMISGMGEGGAKAGQGQPQGSPLGGPQKAPMLPANFQPGRRNPNVKGY